MKIKDRTGGEHSRRRSAFGAGAVVKRAAGLLLACSALAPLAANSAAAQTAAPALADRTASRPAITADAQSVFPPVAGSQPFNASPANPAGQIDPAASPALPQTGTDPDLTTSAIPAATPGVDPPYAPDLNLPYDDPAPPLDPGAGPVQSQEPPNSPTDPTGIRIGSFLLRPSISQAIATETRRSNGSKTRRDYLATGLRGTLTSDWSRHALTVTGEGTFEHNISGEQDGLRPEANINADLRLDLSDETVAHITGGYGFTREDDYDPNALGGATTQSGVHQFTGGASITRSLGRIRGTAALDLSRSVYTDAKLSNGAVVSRTDRDRTGIDGRLRLGYELSPAIVPFVELATGRTFYDLKRDRAGYARSSQGYAARTGVEFDMGEKLRGELAAGYELVDYDDARLDSVGAFTLDGNATWSPRRGTDVNLGLRTSVQDSTSPGQNGWVEYQLTTAIAHQLRDNIVARLSGGATLRDFATSGLESETVWAAGAGVTWSINHYLDLTGDLSYERATGGDADNSVLRAGLGLTLKR